jgi:hypothetical protein
VTDVANPVHALAAVREIAPFIRSEALRRLVDLVCDFWGSERSACFVCGHMAAACAGASFSCDEGYSLKLSSSEGKELAAWERKGYCLFREGKRIQNRIALWLDSRVYDTGIWIYRGMGNACSEQQSLIFDELQQ